MDSKRKSEGIGGSESLSKKQRMGDPGELTIIEDTYNLNNLTMDKFPLVRTRVRLLISLKEQYHQTGQMSCYRIVDEEIKEIAKAITKIKMDLFEQARMIVRDLDRN